MLEGYGSLTITKSTFKFEFRFSIETCDCVKILRHDVPFQWFFGRGADSGIGAKGTTGRNHCGADPVEIEK